MRSSETIPPDPDAPLRWACAEFLGQVRLAIPVSSLSVVLLEPESDTSRVVFSWGLRPEVGACFYPDNSVTPPAEPAGPLATSLVPSQTTLAPGTVHNLGSSPNGSGPTMSVPLRGRQETLGAVLFHSPAPSGYTPEERSLAQRFADQLALHVENIRLRQQMEQRAIEAQVMDRIAQAASSGGPVERVYRQFAAEVKKLVDYHRLSIYLADPEADLLTCVYRVGQRVRRRRPGDTFKLSGSRSASAVLERRCYTIHDLMQDPGPSRSAGPGRPGPRTGWLRSALLAPVVYAENVVGVMELEHRTPRAYGPAEEKLLSRAAASLGPPMGNCRRYGELTRRAQELSLARQDAQKEAREVSLAAQAARVLVSGQPLPEVFSHFAAVAYKLVPFHRAALSWIDPNGCDIQTARTSTADSTPLGDAGSLTSETLASSVRSEQATCGAAGQRVHTKLVYRGKNIGVLTLWRCGSTFTAQEQAVLDRLGGQIAPAVQHARLYQQARRQAYQLEQLLRGQPPLATTLTEPSPRQRVEGRRRLDSLRRELLVDAAHSLRAPLTAIKGYSSTLLQYDVDWPPQLQREFLETIQRETDRLNQMVSDLLAPTQSETSALRLQPELCAVEDLFDTARARLAQEPASRPVRFASGPALPKLLADQSRMAQVVVYLVHCADRTAAPGATLLVEARCREGQPLLFVGPAPGPDDGGGSFQSYGLDHTSARSLPGGRGEDDLRLIVCKALLEAHGTTLQAVPAEPGQTAFCFALPVAAPGAQEDSADLWQ